MAWCWRETPDASTNFDLLYIYSDDNGRTWKNNSGNTVAISGNSYITKNTSGLKVWTINKNRGLINQEHMTVDNQGNVHVLLSHMPDSQPDDSNFTNARTKSSYFHYWRDNKGNWQRNSLSLPSIQNFRGKLAASNSGNLYAVLPDLRIASASYETKWTDWKLISNEYSGKFFSDPLIDTNRLKIENKLSIIYPEKNSPNIHYLDYSLDVGYTTTTLPTETPNNSDKSWISSNVFAGAIFDIGNFNDSLNIEFDVTPYSNNIDGVIGYADKSTKIDSYSAMPILVRMNPSGYFDVRNGDSYAENQKIYYSANTTYHVKIMAKIKERLYDVWVNNTQIASNYKFRNDSPIIDDIGQVCLISTADKAFKVDNHTKNSNTTVAASNKLPDQNSVLNIMKLVNDYWISGHSDGGNNSWNNAVYHTGNMSLFKASQDLKYYNYSLSFSNKLNWLINSGNPTRNADQQCVGQTFLNLYQLKKDEQKITNIKSNIDAMVNSSQVDDWWWIDAMYIAMPIFTKLGVTQNNTMYFDKMYALYSHNRNQRGLYDTSSHLWYRDENFKYPAKSTTNGKKNFWSRGNSWVFSAMVKVLEELPKSNPNYNEYKTVFQEMATALKDRQRSDGFWNVSLDDPDYYGGCETSGTSAFTYGIAWGINNGYLDSNTYKPVVVKAWNGLVNTAVHYNGKLGYIQGIGDQPSSSQPVTFDSTSDFGVGLFLNAGSEVIKLCDDYKVPINVSIP